MTNAQILLQIRNFKGAAIIVIQAHFTFFMSIWMSDRELEETLKGKQRHNKILITALEFEYKKYRILER